MIAVARLVFSRWGLAVAVVLIVTAVVAWIRYDAASDALREQEREANRAFVGEVERKNAIEEEVSNAPVSDLCRDLGIPGC
ncbi:MAG: hypothetical protein AAF415_02210 [Pseudomonadota bacterium]